MPNDWFKFKKFTINQSASAMKVGTDGVLLGAWTVLPDKGASVLDVGTGTGLLALMIAQKYPGTKISAVEIDMSSCAQARENFDNSEWGDRISLHEVSVQDFILQTKTKTKTKTKFDLILSNPPYFSHSLLNPNEAKSRARHQITLTLEELIIGASGLLNRNGLFNLIIPSDQKDDCLRLAENSGMFPKRILNIRPKPGYNYIRTLMEFSFEEKECVENALTIELNTRHEYSKEYKELTKDFYLKF